MTRTELFALMQHPEQIEGKRLAELRSLVDAYPYCASFVFVYLCALAKAEDVRYASELRRLSIYLPDRGKLFDLVEGSGYPQVGRASSMPSAESDTFALIDHYLEQAKVDGVDLPSDLGLDAPVVGDYFAGVQPLTDQEQASSQGGVPDPLLITLEVSSAPSVERTSVSDDSLSEDLFTETLARIYIQQGRYDKALRMIRSISLNYPKKNRYFAEQIRFLERLIQNNKE